MSATPASEREVETARLNPLRSLRAAALPDLSGLADVAVSAAGLFDAPMAMVLGVDIAGARILASHGLDLSDIERARAFCDAALLAGGAAVVGPAGADDPAMALGARFYAVAPILASTGQPLGALCVMDRTARVAVDAHLLAALQTLARLTGAELERRRLAAQAGAVGAREQAQAQLREREASFRYLFDQNPSPMIVCADQSFHVLAANDSALRLYGTTREAFLGQQPDQEQDRRARPPAPAHGAGVSFVSVATHRRRSGEAFSCDVRASAITFGGRPAWLLVVRDISEQQQAQSRLAEAEDKLRQAQKLEAIGHLTGGIAHDFNNLLAVILGSVELLQEELPAGSSGGDLLAVAAQAAERGADLTSQLLSFARRQALAPHAVDINALLGKVHALLTRSVGRHIETNFAPDPTLRPALIDSTQLETAVLNLVVNARDAMPDGGSITLSTSNGSVESALDQPDVMPGDYVVITVSDTGTGMTPEVLSKAFDPFFSTKETGKGSGLGLSMVYGFVRQSGGHVRIESAVDAGTEVHLYLPCAPREAAATPIAVRSAGAAPGGNESILVVEDDAQMRDLVQAHLSGLGYHVLVAGNGIEALDILMGPERIDLMLSDLVMPGGLTGLQLSEQAARVRPGLRILFAAGYPQGALDAPEGRDEAPAPLHKPYRRGELATRIRELLDA
ncbi:ATP-binding protein [Reyranella sp. CPCC 100927]|uniref:hybrid sensor histidine kinase/response regulator n=1 Tax=Reyranella sp. CPCC 100927 TaxID=2599616 RepID=UPI0011B3C74B|nr:ATP-binding protein [Reyranella sp. CPCC 100927]TWT14119.1 PAS domain S-box protein [Reyranella sp. CPCC 100927]